MKHDVTDHMAPTADDKPNKLPRKGKVAKPKGPEFKIDNRDNPGLHRLYVEHAVECLSTVDKAMAEIANLSKTSVFGFMEAMQRERAILVKEDAAYAEADKLLAIARKIQGAPQ